MTSEGNTDTIYINLHLANENEEIVPQREVDNVRVKNLFNLWSNSGLLENHASKRDLGESVEEITTALGDQADYFRNLDHDELKGLLNISVTILSC